MKRFLLLTPFIIVISIFAESQDIKKVLFIGNSYTYANDLPVLISQIAHSKGDSVWHDQNTPGGYTFQMHCQNQVTLAKIGETNWDYVVLQEQSQLPSWPPDSVQLLVYPYADTLTQHIKANDSCSTTLFFMTWGRQNGDVDNCPWYPVVCTYTGMQSRLRQSYLEMGQMFGAGVSPVGIAWQHTRTQFPAIELYVSDGSHPNIYGSYLAACTFYGAIFQKSPMGAYIPPAIPTDTALLLQQIANYTVFDSLPVWHIDTTHVYAGFTFSLLGGGAVQFTNASLNAQRFYWDFGDQSHSTVANPIHTYATPGNYIVTLYANKECEVDSLSQSLVIVSAGALSDRQTPILYPNPASDRITADHAWIEKAGPLEYRVADQQGKTILSGILKKDEATISISRLVPGTYLILFSRIGTVVEEEIVVKKW
ncbi:MAG: PKD domain-containing protein [Bacteroidetes bacterium]|nr:PKD domain-containing protein [Bacteroidota bacterium]